jgi:hypothetical protein
MTSPFEGTINIDILERQAVAMLARGWPSAHANAAADVG